MDALISERLSSSPRIVDIYGHCGLAMFSEFFAIGDIEQAIVPTGGYMKQSDLHDQHELKPQNDIPTADKLLVALEMAHAIADLHGFEGGAIIHGDIQLSQFIETPGAELKLNDFNRGEISLYSEEKHQYCKHRNGWAQGNVSIWLQLWMI